MFFRLFRHIALCTQAAVNRLPILKRLEKYMIEQQPLTPLPSPIFIIGPPRSGSTFLYQVLLSHFRFAYLTNLASLFYSCPCYSTKLGQKFFGEYHERSYKSRYGYVDGIMAPSEAGRLMKYWFRAEDQNHYKDVNRSLKTLSSIMGGPCLFKNLLLSFKLQELIKAFPKATFLYVTRDPLYMTQSFILARKKQPHLDEIWFSNQSLTKETSELFRQIAYRLKEIQDGIEASKAYIPKSQFFEISYESLCENIPETLKTLGGIVEGNGISLQRKDSPKISLNHSQRTLLCPDEMAILRGLVSQIFS